MTKSRELRQSLVSLVKFEETVVTLEEAIQKALDLVHFRFDEAIRSVVIKPNLFYFLDSSTGETTDPRFVSALIDVIRNNTSSRVEISIVESDTSARECQYVFKMLGYEKMAKEKSVELVNLTKTKSQKTTVTVHQFPHEFLVPQTIASADLLINIPKIRYMPQVKISCGLKNMYGCNPNPAKFRHHLRLDETIVGLNKIMKPHLCVLDGLVVKGVRTARLGLVMASTDPVAFDIVASEIAGINPDSVQHIALASREELGNVDFVPVGSDLSYFRGMFPSRTLAYKLKGLLGAVYAKLSP